LQEQGLVIKGAQTIIFFDQQLVLLPQRAIYWHNEGMLFLSDLHFGKATHFRKFGIPVPVAVFEKDLDTLSYLMDSLQPRQICFLGDLFHSDMNSEFDTFCHWRNSYSAVDMELVRGNHDILPAIYYKNACVKVYPAFVEKGPFLFSHDPVSRQEHHNYMFSGHLHPGVRLRGNGKQSLDFPCFYFGECQALLPAFGTFTGFSLVRPAKNDLVYIIADDKVHKV
jgi:DNA ligase-associated metallophosphoesterase